METHTAESIQALAERIRSSLHGDMRRSILQMAGYDRPEWKEMLGKLLPACGVGEVIFCEADRAEHRSMRGMEISALPPCPEELLPQKNIAVPFLLPIRGWLVYFTDNLDEMGLAVHTAEALGACGAGLYRMDEASFCVGFFGGREHGSAILRRENAAVPRGDASALLWDAAVLLYAGGFHRTLSGAADCVRHAEKIFR